MTELRALTGLRGIAAWLVVLYHIRLSIAGLPPGVERVLAKGYLAVDFFFLLSGFVIWLAWGTRLRDPRQVPAFLRKRIARIWPLHLVVLAGAIALAAAMTLSGRDVSAAFPVGELPLHLLLVQNWGFTRDLSWNDPAWSISAELAAYLLFPLLVMAIDWRRVPTPAIMAAILAAATLLASVYAGHDLGYAIPRLGLMRCTIEFAIGTAIGALWLRWRHTPRVALPVGTIGAALIVAPLPEPLRIPLAFASLLLALALTAGRPGNPLEGRAIHYLGAISYATYLGHFLLWFAFKLTLDEAIAVPPALIALYLALVLASSIALYHLVERPAQRAINGVKFSRGTERATAGDAGGGGGPPQAIR